MRALRNGAVGFMRGFLGRRPKYAPWLLALEPWPGLVWPGTYRGSGMTIRVFLVDDHALVRTGLRMILSAETDIEVVGEAESGEEALPLVRKLEPDVVLCDLHLPGISGLEVTERIVRSGLQARVLVVSVLEDGPLPKRLLDVGAHGYVGKGGDARELLRAVRDVARGRRCLGRSIAERSEEHTSELQSRENLVCRLLLEKKNRQTEIGRAHV